MTTSQNALFTGESPPDDEGDPPGAGIARLIERSLRNRGYSTKAIDNWRDCGWSFVSSVNDVPFEISLASTDTGNFWMLQIACINKPGMVRRLFRERAVDHSNAIQSIAFDVHEILRSNGYDQIRWCSNGYPDDHASTPEPRTP